MSLYKGRNEVEEYKNDQNRWNHAPAFVSVAMQLSHTNVKADVTFSLDLLPLLIH